MTQPARFRRGRLAEDLVARHVEALGMRILERNLRVGYLEIDIVARDGDRIAIVEVRGRGAASWQVGLDTLTWDKRKRLRRAAAILWSRRWARHRSLQGVRFDVAAVNLDASPPRITYVKAAF